MAILETVKVQIKVKVVGYGSRRRLKVLACVAKLLGINLEVKVNE